ncbi:MAG: 3-oxoadipate enol-lactonase [Hyphomicrobiales bacterium]|nr:3-oxoadipate enol-lactonase [Hyphomicrobiales bacterium]
MLDCTAANGINIHYRLSGPKDAPLIVFSNSLGTDFRIWSAVEEIIVPHMRCLFYDSRGHGLTDCPPGPYTIIDEVGDLSALIDALHLDPTILCGLSVGGVIAQAFAAAHPGRIEGLVLCDTAAKVLDAETWTGRMKIIENGGIEAVADATMERWFTERFRAEEPERLAGMRNMLNRTPKDGYLATCAVLRDTDLRESSAKLDLPTLCLCGDEDGSTTPDVVRATADLIPHATFHLIEGAGHIPCVEQPEVTAGHILAFAREHNLMS